MRNRPRSTATSANLSTETGRRTILRDQGLENARDLFEDVTGRAIAPDLMIVPVLVVRQYRPRKLIVGSNPLSHDVFLIVFARVKRRAVVIAESRFFGRLVKQ